jgi:acyl dehydratase
MASSDAVVQNPRFSPGELSGFQRPSRSRRFCPGDSSVVVARDGRWKNHGWGAVAYDRTFTVEEIQQFAEISGNIQPRHTEPDADGRVMVQGLLTATMPTKLGGDREVLAPRMEFESIQPVYTGEHITCRATYDEVSEREDRYEFTWVVCENDDGGTVLETTIDGIIWKDD